MGKIISIPRMGFYTEIFEDLFNDLGINCIKTKYIDQDIIKKGVKHSSDMMCFPFKVVLGCFIDGLDRGANTALMWGEQDSLCRIGQYYNIAGQILKDLGYDFEMVNMPPTPQGIVGTLCRLSGKNPIAVSKKILQYYKIILAEEQERFPFDENADIKIGITGEIYTVLEPYVNYNIIRKLHDMGVSVDVSTKLSHFLTQRMNLIERRKENKELQPYMWGDLGGHGRYSLYSSIGYAKNGFDGIIHLLPLSCMPETTIEMLMNRVGQKYNIPIYRFPIDENRFEAGFDTRIETFISVLKRKSKCISA